MTKTPIEPMALEIARIIDKTVKLKASGAPCGGWIFVGLDKAAGEILDAVRAALASILVTDELVERGLAGMKARDAEGWGDEDEDRIDLELTRAVLKGALGAQETIEDVLASIAPDGHVCGPIEATEDQFQRLEDAIARREADRVARMPTLQATLDVLQDAYRRLEDLGFKDAIYCPKDGTAFEGVEAGCTSTGRYHYEGTWPDGTFWLRDDGDLWPSRPILWRPIEAAESQPVEAKAADQ